MAEPEISRLSEIVDNSCVQSLNDQKAGHQMNLCSQALLVLLENLQTAKQVEF